MRNGEKFLSYNRFPKLVVGFCEAVVLVLWAHGFLNGRFVKSIDSIEDLPLECQWSGALSPPYPRTAQWLGIPDGWREEWTCWLVLWAVRKENGG